jgi:hypothetical protein
MSLATFAERHPNVPIAQLAIAATGPLATLKSFAFDSNYDGVVLLSLNPENLLPPRENDQLEYLDFYRSRWTLDQRMNFRIANLIEPFVITRHFNYGVDNILRRLLNDGRLPVGALYIRVSERREHDADFTLTDGMRLQEQRYPDVRARYEYLEKIVGEAWPITLGVLRDSVSAIHGRGGCVVLVRMPSGGRWLEEDRRLFGSSVYWEDVLDALGVYGVHYRDMAGVQNLPYPDGEHVDARDQVRLTTAMLDALDALGIYDETRSCRPAPETVGIPSDASQ